MINQTQIKEVESLFALGAHLGHKKNRLHPKARKNVYQMINGTSIIDLTRTVDQLKKAKEYLAQAAKEEKTILVVGTKKVASAFLKEYAETNTIPYITSKWLPGLLTNFKTIMNNVHKLKDWKEKQVTGEFNKLVKHERTQIQKEINKLERLYSGLVHVNARPDILVVADVRKEKNAVAEAQTFRIPVVAIADTNVNPDTIDYPVVANDDDAKVVEYMMKELLDAYVNARVKVEKDIKPEKK